ncbi:hypothetical protein GCM10010315_46220 [Streptomyces luteosporeus]|uniref:Transposase n=1 Tax=Streptomyces luteosporeus TaxID=173856 RepID=A0ABP6GE18_9ACTN
MTVERDEDSRRWMAAYLKTPARTLGRPSEEARCPNHPEKRMERVLGQRWVCPECVRRAAAG